MHYRWKTGMLAWAMFRITGLALVGYMAMHIIVISNLHDPAKFDATMGFLGSWTFRLLEIGLFVVVLYHALNGVRIFIVDFFNGALFQARLFWILMAVGGVLFIAGAYPMFSHAMHWKHIQQGSAHTQLMKPAGSACCQPDAGKEASHD
jgi:succinate dehydrogenase / fumarate reductase cytochrome b subunit